MTNKFVRRVPSCLLLAAWGGLLAACEGPPAEGDLQAGDQIEKQQQPVLADKIVFWPGPPSIIPVCWKASATGANRAAMRGEIQRAVESQYTRYSRANFVGWSACTGSASEVSSRHVEVDINAEPGAQCFKQRNEVATKCRFNEGYTGTLLTATALHEFGHSLGFYHEEERPGYDDRAYWGCQPGQACVPAGCKSAQTAPDLIPVSPITYGGYDPNGTMSYCDVKHKGGTELSPNDYLAIQHAYGYRRNAIVSPRGNCLSVNPASAGGTSTFVWDCQETSGNTWAFSVDGRFRSLVDSTQCLGMPSQVNGDPLRSVPCSDSGTQWKLENIEIRGYGEKCLDLLGGNTANGSPVGIWECLGNANQKWSVSSSGEIKFGSLASTKCLTAAGGVSSDGTDLVISDCTGAASQKWSFSGNNIKTAGKCMDVEGPGADSNFVNGRVGTNADPNLPRNGWTLQLWSCLRDQYNQMWHLSGPIKQGGKCADNLGGNPANGASVGAWDCLGNGNQVWDVYF